MSTNGPTWRPPSPAQNTGLEDLVEALSQLVTVAPGLMTPSEAASWLRLTENGENVDAARQKMNRLVTAGKIRPCLVGGRRLYSKTELTRFVNTQTEKYK